MKNIDMGKCINCGKCAFVCSFGALAMEGVKPIMNDACKDCGHCVAICPTGAISYSDTDENIVEYDSTSFDIEPNTLLNFIKFRRSIRFYTDKDISDMQLEHIIEAGRYSPTGGNRQPLRYIVVQGDMLEKIKEKTIVGLYDMATNHPDEPPFDKIPRYVNMYKKLHEDYKNQKIDHLFFEAPMLIIVVGDTTAGGNIDVDGGIAVSNMELMTYSLGLGCCYIGNFVTAARLLPEVREKLAIKETERIITALTIGEPDIKYKRTVLRKKIDITIMK